MGMILPSKALLKSFVGLDVLSDAEDIENDDLKFRRRHVFKIGNFGFMLPENSSNEVVEDMSYCKLPNTNTVLYGMANLRGKIIPVINLHNFFGIEHDVQTKSKILVITFDESAAGILINDLPTRIKFTDKHCLSSIPHVPEVIRSYINSCYQVEGSDWFSWNVNDFFDDVYKYIQ